MNKLSKMTMLIIAALLTSCTTTQTGSANLTGITEAIGNNWKLIEVWINNRNTGFERETLNRDGFGDFFSFKIEREQISGIGAPNRYSAPYTLLDEDPLYVQIAVVRSTLMASIYQPEKLREHDFFNYIQNTYKWGLSGEDLILYSKTQEGAEVVLKFSL